MQTCGTFALKQVRVLKGFIFDQPSVVLCARDGFMRSFPIFFCRRDGCALDSGSSGSVSSPFFFFFFPFQAIVLFSWANTLLQQCLSLPRCLNGYRRPYPVGDPARD